MIGTAATWKPDRFIKIQLPFSAWLRRAIPDPRVGEKLFCYYSIVNRTYVVGMWADRYRRKFFDVLNLGYEPNLSTEQAAHLRSLFATPLLRDELARRVKQEMWNQAVDLNDHEGEFADWMQWNHDRVHKLKVQEALYGNP